MRRAASLILFVAHTLALSAGVAWSHPLSQGALDVVVYPDRVAVRARVTLEEVVVTDMLAGGTVADAAAAGPAGGSLFERHARYLAAHLHVAADGAPLLGRVVSTEPPATQPAEQAAGPDQQHAVYELEYATATRPQKVTLGHDVLVDAAGFAPGVTWEASYVVRIGVAGNAAAATEGLLLTTEQPVEYTCDWQASAAAGSEVDAGGPAGRWRLARDYAAHGVRHILTGSDQLLFITALVLAAVSVWDLVKVVTAFTLAHTITLTLASLGWVSLPSGIVEPMIAASIVLVALQNVFWPGHARGWTRLLLAFGFGLFHGLGYAGGLIDAMQEMSGLTVVLAILAFSVGVEIGHQVVVIPLFGALKLARRVKREPPDRDRVSTLALRYGSAVICAVGMYYFYAAVSAAVTTSTHT